MHDAPPRRNGGIGFALSSPQATLTFTASAVFAIADRRHRPLRDTEIASLVGALSVARATLGLKNAVTVVITGELATHVGMGSGTAIRLACIEAMLALNGIELPREEVVRLSGRGGTSGIGINTYFEGGLVLDLGARNDGAGYAPSSMVRPKELPYSLPGLSLPDWEICLFVPRNIPTKSQWEEAEFFQRVLPLSPDASYRACYEALFGVYASIAEQDAVNFVAAIERMQSTDWKSQEWREYGGALSALRDELRNLGAEYVGMSSLGPMLFAGGPSVFSSDAQGAAESLNCDAIISRMSNVGRVMEVIS
ncbi:MAG: beta-ribofuranosylaminobenzene 5'-phosphate synthase [Sphingomonadales bacterium]|nr:MAG: beta-ribofuranosylaminobenzene 5'-phosphate synthase [Sphingomonadales bacterium]